MRTHADFHGPKDPLLLATYLLKFQFPNVDILHFIENLKLAATTMPALNRFKFWSHQYQPIMDQPENSHTCPSCEKQSYSRPARLQSLAIVLGIMGLLLGGYALFKIDSCGHGSKVQDDFISAPFYGRKFMEDSRFVDSDPHDGVWDLGLQYPTQPRTAWDEVYAGAWIEIPHPKDYDLSGGLHMKTFYNDYLSPESEIYVPSVFHQIHCVGEIKHAVIMLQNGEQLPKHEHVTHCIEYLRQAVLCSGDLTLERPSFVSDKTWRGTTGWDAVHQCRDLTNLYAFQQPNFSSVAIPAPKHEGK